MDCSVFNNVRYLVWFQAATSQSFQGKLFTWWDRIWGSPNQVWGTASQVYSDTIGMCQPRIDNKDMTNSTKNVSGNASRNDILVFFSNLETLCVETLYHSSFRSNLFECVGRELIENMTNSSRSFITFRALPKPWNFSINNITRNSSRN